MNTKNWNWNVILGISAIVAMVVVGICIFYFTPDNGYTGKDALKDQSASFWIWVAIGAIVFLLSLWGIIVEQNTKWGSVGLTVALIVVGVMCLFNPFGRACTDKANGGVTTPKHVVTQ